MLTAADLRLARRSDLGAHWAQAVDAALFCALLYGYFPLDKHIRLAFYGSLRPTWL